MVDGHLGGGRQSPGWRRQREETGGARRYQTEGGARWDPHLLPLAPGQTLCEPMAPGQSSALLLSIFGGLKLMIWAVFFKI